MVQTGLLVREDLRNFFDAGLENVLDRFQHRHSNGNGNGNEHVVDTPEQLDTPEPGEPEAELECRDL